MSLWPSKRRKKRTCFSARFIFYFAIAFIAVYCLAELLFISRMGIFNSDREYTCNKKNNKIVYGMDANPIPRE